MYVGLGGGSLGVCRASHSTVGLEGRAGWPEGQLGQDGANWGSFGTRLADVVRQLLGGYFT